MNSVLMTAAANMDRKINEATDQTKYGVFVDFLIAFLPTLIQLLGMCQTPIPPAPAPPNPDPTPEFSAAWGKAWTMKARAVDAFDEDTQDYDAHTLRNIARKAKREKRKDGERINTRESIEIARQFLDAGRVDDMQTITAGILEARA